MATLYIDPDSATNGVGSEADPFNAWGSVTWTAGNTYKGKCGTRHPGTITVGASGTAGNPITITSYGTGARPIIQGAAAEHGINLGTRAYINIVGMHAIAGSNSTRNGINGLAIDAITAHFIYISDCIIESPTSVGGIGAQLRGAGDTIKHCEVKNCVDDALFLTVSNCLVEGNYLHDFDTAQGGDGDGIQFAGTHDYGLTVMRNNRIIGHTNGPIKQCVITAAGSGTFRVEGGEYYGMVTGLSIAVPGAVIQGAKVWGGTSRGVTCAGANIKVKSTLVYDTPMAVGLDTVTGVEVTNCTLDASEYGISASSGAAAYNARNNWIAADVAAHLLSATATATASGNRYQTGSAFKINTTFYDLAGWKTASSADADAAEVVPLLSDDYRPMPSSPLLGAGNHISYSRDLDGKQRPNPPSIGAYDVAVLRRVLGT